MALTQLFRGRPIESLRERMQQFAEEFGVAMTVPEHISNTRRALAISEYARDLGRLEAFRDAATHGYWSQGMDLESDADLARIAERAGLDPDASLRASTSDGYVRKVQQNRQMGIEEMVTGVPTLFVAGMPVIGCQRYETFENVMKRVGVPRRALP